MKSLYFMHIPATGGEFVRDSMVSAAAANNLSFYTSNQAPHPSTLESQIIISGHFGSYPTDNIPGIDTAVLIRNPIDRCISHFNDIHDVMLAERQEYISISNYFDRLKFYLFEDPNFTNQSNMQSRFICNSADPTIFDETKYNGVIYKINHDERNKPGGFSWFIPNDNTTLSFAKERVDSFYAAGTLDNLDSFMQKINIWFNDNYNINISYDTNLIVNESVVMFNDIAYRTSELKSMLSSDEIDKVVQNNSIDYELYQYVLKKG